MLSSDWLIKGVFFANSYFFSLFPHHKGICFWEFCTAANTTVLGKYPARGKIPSLNSL